MAAGVAADRYGNVVVIVVCGREGRGEGPGGGPPPPAFFFVYPCASRRLATRQPPFYLPFKLQSPVFSALFFDGAIFWCVQAKRTLICRGWS